MHDFQAADRIIQIFKWSNCNKSHVKPYKTIWSQGEMDQLKKHEQKAKKSDSKRDTS